MSTIIESKDSKSENIVSVETMTEYSESTQTTSKNIISDEIISGYTEAVRIIKLYENTLFENKGLNPNIDIGFVICMIYNDKDMYYTKDIVNDPLNSKFNILRYDVTPTEKIYLLGISERCELCYTNLKKLLTDMFETNFFLCPKDNKDPEKSIKIIDQFQDNISMYNSNKNIQDKILHKCVFRVLAKLWLKLTNTKIYTLKNLDADLFYKSLEAINNDWEKIIKNL
jgi:hypothetical protein